MNITGCPTKFCKGCKSNNPELIKVRRSGNNPTYPNLLLYPKLA